LEKAMIKFQSVEGCEAYISDSGCLVIKQQCLEFGKEVSVVLTPGMAWEIAQMVQDCNEEMVFKWSDGMMEP
jgi:phosphoribosylamine-glycine ligase